MKAPSLAIGHGMRSVNIATNNSTVAQQSARLQTRSGASGLWQSQRETSWVCTIVGRSLHSKGCSSRYNKRQLAQI